MSVEALRTNIRLRASVPQHRLFKVSASACNLRVGDHVIEETTVGQDFSSGLSVRAGCRGVVMVVNWCADDKPLRLGASRPESRRIVARQPGWRE